MVILRRAATRLSTGSGAALLIVTDISAANTAPPEVAPLGKGCKWMLAENLWMSRGMKTHVEAKGRVR